MADLNTVTLSGNLTRDPELRSTSGGKSVVSLRLASKGFGDRSGYYDVTAWDKLAELLATALGKGSPLTVVGRLEYREWTAQDGAKRNAVGIVAQDVKLPPRTDSPSSPAQPDDDDIDF